MATVISFIIVSILIYLGIAAILIIFGKLRSVHPQEENPVFVELLRDYSGIPPLQTFLARDGASLHFRHYPACASKVLILLHGSGWHSRYFYPLASHISTHDLAAVYTPDLRGHGAHPQHRGDIAYMDQLQDDLADLIEVVRHRHPGARVIVGGHSSGGGLAIRFAGTSPGAEVDGYLLLSPWLQYNAPTVRPNAGGWAGPHTGRIIGLTMFNNIGIHLWDHLTAIEFNLPEKYRDGTETLSYSHRLNTGFAPVNYKKALMAISQPVMVVVGTADRAFIAEQFGPAIRPYVNAEISLLPGVSHMGVVVGPEVREVITVWLNGFDADSRH